MKEHHVERVRRSTGGEGRGSLKHNDSYTSNPSLPPSLLPSLRPSLLPLPPSLLPYLDVASSRSRIFDRRKRARARHSSCRCPDERFSPYSDTG